MFVCVVIEIKISKIKVLADSLSDVGFCTSEMVLFVVLNLYVAKEREAAPSYCYIKDVVSS